MIVLTFGSGRASALGRVTSMNSLSRFPVPEGPSEGGACVRVKSWLAYLAVPQAYTQGFFEEPGVTINMAGALATGVFLGSNWQTSFWF